MRRGEAGRSRRGARNRKRSPAD